MALVPLRKVLDHAAENGYGVAAFNVKQHGTNPVHYGSGQGNEFSRYHPTSRGARSYSQDAFLRT